MTSLIRNPFSVLQASLLGLAVISVCGATAARADIYKYTNEHGEVFLTDRPSHSGYRLLVKTWKGWEEKRLPNYAALAANKRRFSQAIRQTARQHGLPEALLHAVITAESAYDPDALSRAGALGLMQLMPATARRYGVGNRRNPIDNLQGGTRYLRDLLQMFDNRLSLALAAYNAGENAVIKYGYQIPPYQETQNYVRKVMGFYRQYRSENS